ncbi:MAG: hypothetical protein BWY42_00829 [Candidatus Omnitrophica bacterium ADurb.Bin277]|nr:MAG: hypothetical protein BWY42_00829 [Candidatus Omnitrophica bacterium ADurb.Bin277]
MQNLIELQNNVLIAVIYDHRYPKNIHHQDRFLLEMLLDLIECFSLVFKETELKSPQNSFRKKSQKRPQILPYLNIRVVLLLILETPQGREIFFDMVKLDKKV